MAKLTEDPLFQLNLVLFAAFPFPSGTRINPIFYNAGYQLFKISPTLTLPMPLINKIQAIPIQIKSAVTPEVLLRHITSGKVRIIECKKSSFSSTSTTARQAASYLALHGSVLNNAIGALRTSELASDLLYLVKEGDEALLKECLDEIASSIKQVGCAVNEFGVGGLAEEDDGVYLYTENADNLEAIEKQVKIIDGEKGSDYRTLYLIPMDPSINAKDSYAEDAVKSRLRSSLAAILIRLTGVKEFTLNAEMLLNRSIQVWTIWEDSDSKKKLKKITRNYIRQILNVLVKKCGIIVTEVGTSWVISSVTDKQKVNLVRYFSSAGYRLGNIDLNDNQIELELE